MYSIDINGPRAALSDPLTLWEIARQLFAQRAKRERGISAGEVRGAVEMEPYAPVIPVIEILKARGRGGEVELVRELAEDMTRRYTRRAESLADELADMLSEAAPADADLAREADADAISKAGLPPGLTRPPEAVARAARRGLELRRKYKRGGLSTQEAGEQGIGSGVQRAVNLSHRDELTLETLKMMRGFFSRHAKNARGTHPDGGPSAGAIAWLLWGGDQGRAWVERTLDTIERMSAEEVR